MQTKDSLRALQYCTSAIGQPSGHLMRYCCTEQALRLLATYRQLGARFCSSAIPIATGSVGDLSGTGPRRVAASRAGPPCTQKHTHRRLLVHNEAYTLARWMSRSRQGTLGANQNVSF